MVLPIRCTSLSNLDIRTECLDDLHLTKKYFAKSPTVEYNRVINFIRWSRELPGSNLLLANSDEILTACPRRMHILLSLSEMLFLKYHRIRQSIYIIYVKFTHYKDLGSEIFNNFCVRFFIIRTLRYPP